MSVLLQIEIKGGQECFVSSGKKVCGEWYFALLKLAPSRRPEKLPLNGYSVANFV